MSTPMYLSKSEFITKTNTMKKLNILLALIIGLLLVAINLDAQSYTDVTKNGDTIITTITPAQFTPATVTRVTKPYQPPVITKPEEPPVALWRIFGFGSKATGGEGKTVIEATTLTSAMLQSNRYIKFVKDADISGTFHISGLTNLTIDANGFDVTLRNGNGDGLSIRGGSSNIVIKGLRVINASNDCINVIEKSYNWAIVNCTAYGGGDGSIDCANGNDGTVQNCLIGPSFGEGPNLNTAKNVSITGNVYFGGNIGKAERMFYSHANYTPGVGAPNVDFRYNVVWLHGRYGSGAAYGATANVVGNYYQSATSGTSEMGITTDPDVNERTGLIYTSGNVSGRGTNLNDNGNRSTEIPIAEYAKIPGGLTACEAAKVAVRTAGTTKKKAVEFTKSGVKYTFDEAQWVSSITLPGCN